MSSLIFLPWFRMLVQHATRSSFRNTLLLISFDIEVRPPPVVNRSSPTTMRSNATLDCRRKAGSESLVTLPPRLPASWLVFIITLIIVVLDCQLRISMPLAVCTVLHGLITARTASCLHTHLCPFIKESNLSTRLLRTARTRIPDTPAWISELSVSPCIVSDRIRSLCALLLLEYPDHAALESVCISHMARSIYHLPDTFRPSIFQCALTRVSSILTLKPVCLRLRLLGCKQHPQPLSIYLPFIVSIHPVEKIPRRVPDTTYGVVLCSSSCLASLGPARGLS